MLTLAIIEDHQVLVDSLSLMLHQEKDIKILGTADSLLKGRELIYKVKPNVLLLDVVLPDGNGLELLPEVRAVSPETQVVVLTSLSDEATLMRAIENGVSAFVSKSSSFAQLIAAIRQAAQGEIIMPASLLMGLIQRMPRDKSATYRQVKGWERLTHRELKVLEMLARGKKGDEIAAELHIAPLTVRTHIRNLMAKLEVHSRLEAVIFGLRHGLINPPV